MDSNGFSRAYFHQLLTELLARTRPYPLHCFDVIAAEPAGAPEAVIRAYRLKTIIAGVKTLGVKKFYHTPLTLRGIHRQEDWIQDAMRILLEQAAEYDPQRLPSFNRYIIYRVNQRLIDVQRTLLRQYQAAEEELPAADTLTPDVTSGISPAEQVVQAEQWQVLWECLEHLDPSRKMLFVLHELEEVSFQELFEKFGAVLASNSQSTFQRRYYQEIFAVVQQQVRERYTEAGSALR